MTQVLVVASRPPEAPDLVHDLQSLGLPVCARCECTEMVREVVRHAPDLVLVWAPLPGEELFQAVQLLGSASTAAVLVFTSDVHAESMERALEVGIDSWEVNGYAPSRLRPLVQYTLARARQSRRMREELTSLQRRYEERRLVEKAKGLLMNQRKIDEDQAFRLLRSASMHAKMRIGQLSQQVIESALYAEGINRAGRLRMLSQRIVKLYALLVVGVEQASSRALLADSRQQGEAIFTALERCLSRPTFGDLLDATAAMWSALRGALDAPVQPGSLVQVQRLGEDLLVQAERLTAAIASVGGAPALQVINVSGRQRMLAQRYAQQALLGQLLAQPPGPLDGHAGASSSAQAFEQGLDYLEALPLATASIRDGLAAARLAWARMLEGAAHADRPQGQVALASASEELLEIFDQLTGTYEHSMQLLTG